MRRIKIRVRIGVQFTAGIFSPPRRRDAEKIWPRIFADDADRKEESLAMIYTDYTDQNKAQIRVIRGNPWLNLPLGVSASRR